MFYVDRLRGFNITSNLFIFISFTRLKMALEASQSDSASDNNQHQVTATLHHGSTTHHNSDVPVESGLGWFHSITSSASSDDMTSPIITSTQHDHNGHQTSTGVKQPNCHTELNVSESSLTSDGDDGSEASQKKNRKNGTSENRRDKRPKTQKETTNDFVFQKISKNLRVRRMALNKQQCEPGGDHWQRECKASKSAASALDPTSSTLPSDETGPTDRLVQGNLCTTTPARSESKGTENISSVLKEKMAADAEVDLHAKLSGFAFKPRKMKASVPDLTAPSIVSDTFRTGGELDGSDLHANTERKESESVSAHHGRRLSKGGGRRCVTEVGGSMCEARCSTLEQDKSVQGKRLSRTNESADHPVSVCGQTGGRVPASSSSSAINDPTPSKSAVASSALAKLSRFAFTCTTEPMAVAQSKEERRRPLAADGAEGLRANSKVERTVMDKVKGLLPPPDTELSQGHEQHQGAGHSNRVPTIGCGGTASVKKRKCFELGPPPTGAVGSADAFSGLSLFHSGDLYDVFDTDWDQEVSKKAKV